MKAISDEGVNRIEGSWGWQVFTLSGTDAALKAKTECPVARLLRRNICMRANAGFMKASHAPR